MLRRARDEAVRAKAKRDGVAGHERNQTKAHLHGRCDVDGARRGPAFGIRAEARVAEVEVSASARSWTARTGAFRAHDPYSIIQLWMLLICASSD